MFQLFGAAKKAKNPVSAEMDTEAYLLLAFNCHVQADFMTKPSHTVIEATAEWGRKLNRKQDAILGKAILLIRDENPKAEKDEQAQIVADNLIGALVENWDLEAALIRRGVKEDEIPNVLKALHRMIWIMASERL